MIDTAKTACVGAGGFMVQFMSMVPDILKIGVAVATLIYVGIKIKKELYK